MSDDCDHVTVYSPAKRRKKRKKRVIRIKTMYSDDNNLAGARKKSRTCFITSNEVKNGVIISEIDTADEGSLPKKRVRARIASTSSESEVMFGGSLSTVTSVNEWDSNDWSNCVKRSRSSTGGSTSMPSSSRNVLDSPSRIVRHRFSSSNSSASSDSSSSLTKECSPTPIKDCSIKKKFNERPIMSSKSIVNNLPVQSLVTSTPIKHRNSCLERPSRPRPKHTIHRSSSSSTSSTSELSTSPRNTKKYKRIIKDSSKEKCLNGSNLKCKKSLKSTSTKSQSSLLERRNNHRSLCDRPNRPCSSSSESSPSSTKESLQIADCNIEKCLHGSTFRNLEESRMKNTLTIPVRIPLRLPIKFPLKTPVHVSLKSSKDNSDGAEVDSEDTEEDSEEDSDGTDSTSDTDSESLEETAEQEEGEFLVQEIHGKRWSDGSWQYRVKWYGYEIDESTWEDEAALECFGHIAAYETKSAPPPPSPAVFKRQHNGPWGFERGLPAEKILGATFASDKQTYYLVKWDHCYETDWVPAIQANQLCPQTVIQFFQERFQLAMDHSREQEKEQEDEDTEEEQEEAEEEIKENEIKEIEKDSEEDMGEVERGEEIQEEQVEETDEDGKESEQDMEEETGEVESGEVPVIQEEQVEETDEDRKESEQDLEEDIGEMERGEEIQEEQVEEKDEDGKEREQDLEEDAGVVERGEEMEKELEVEADEEGKELEHDLDEDVGEEEEGKDLEEEQEEEEEEEEDGNELDHDSDEDIGAVEKGKEMEEEQEKVVEEPVRKEEIEESDDEEDVDVLLLGLESSDLEFEL